MSDRKKLKQQNRAIAKCERAPQLRLPSLELYQILQVNLGNFIHHALMVYNACRTRFHPGRVCSPVRETLIAAPRLIALTQRNLTEEHERSLLTCPAAVPKIRCVIQRLCTLQGEIQPIPKHSARYLRG